MGPKLRKRLSFICHMTDNPSGMYPGDYLESAAAQHMKLERMGYVKIEQPHNPSHLPRVVITNLGREVLRK